MSTPSLNQKITVTLPSPLLSRLNETIAPRQRSAFITRAIQQQLVLLEQAEAVDQTAGSWSDADYPDLADDGAIDAWLAELRHGWPISDSES